MSMEAVYRRRRVDRGEGGATVPATKLQGGGSLPAGSTYTRAGAAVFYDTNGVVQTASSGTVRNAHFLGGVSHFLFEAARTNSALNSADFSQASWTLALCTLSGAQGDPAGGTAAQGIVGTNAVNTLVDGSLNLVNTAAYTVTTGTAQGHAIFAKPGNKSFLFVQTKDAAGAFHNTWVNVTTGATGTKDASHTIKSWPLTAGWYRVEVGLSSSGVGTTLSTAYGFTDADNSHTLTGDGATISGTLWGAQIEIDQMWVTSYIATAGSTASRVADALAFPHNSTPQQRTLYMDMTCVSLQGVAVNAYGFDIGGAFNVNSMYFRNAGSNQASANLDNNGTLVSSAPGAGAVSVGAEIEYRMSADTTPAVTVSQSINQAAEVAGATSGASAAYQAAYTTANYTMQILAGRGAIAIRSFKDIPGAPSNMAACRAAA